MIYYTRAKSNKYNAQKTTIDGIKFDSKKEALRYQELLLLEKSGVIRDLKRQVKYPLCGRTNRVCNHIVDFQYEEGGKVVVSDAKGFPTPVFRLKYKLFLDNYPDIEYRIT